MGFASNNLQAPPPPPQFSVELCKASFRDFFPHLSLKEVLAEWLRHQQAGLVVPVAPREPEEGLLLEGAVEDTEA